MTGEGNQKGRNKIIKKEKKEKGKGKKEKWR